MAQQAKLVLRGDGGEEHAQGRVDAEKYAHVQVVERNGHIYAYVNYKVDKDGLVLLYTETNIPVSITEF